MSIALHKQVPEFEAEATGDVQISNHTHLDDKVVVLFFYPKDHTPSCTAEALEFREKHDAFVKAGAVVYGVSRDNLESHDDFKDKLELPYELIADTEEKMCHMFGVVKNKIMYGRKVKGISRSTFLIGTDGTLQAEWRGIRMRGEENTAEKHVAEVLKAVKALKKSGATKAEAKA